MFGSFSPWGSTFLACVEVYMGKNHGGAFSLTLCLRSCLCHIHLYVICFIEFDFIYNVFAQFYVNMHYLLVDPRAKFYLFQAGSHSIIEFVFYDIWVNFYFNDIVYGNAFIFHAKKKNTGA